MNLNKRYTYLQAQYQRYQQASKAEKSRLLDEMMEVTGLSRNHLIELMVHPPRRKPRTKQRGQSYGPETDAVLRISGEAMNYIGAERLPPVLLKTAQALARFGVIQLTPAIERDLKAISVATLRRHLPSTSKPVHLWRKARPRLNPYQQGVHARPIPWATTEPSHLEEDTVFHCGEKAEGESVVNPVVVDLATGWMQARAVLDRTPGAFRHGNSACAHCTSSRSTSEPVARLLATAQLRPELQARLTAQQQALNPLALKRALDQGMARLFTYPPASPEQPENIYQTLAYPKLFPEACAALDLPCASDPAQVLGPDFPYRIARSG